MNASSLKKARLARTIAASSGITAALLLGGPIAAAHADADAPPATGPANTAGSGATTPTGAATPTGATTPTGADLPATGAPSVTGPANTSVQASPGTPPPTPTAPAIETPTAPAVETPTTPATERSVSPHHTATPSTTSLPSTHTTVANTPESVRNQPLVTVAPPPPAEPTTVVPVMTTASPTVTTPTTASGVVAHADPVPSSVPVMNPSTAPASSGPSAEASGGAPLDQGLVLVAGSTTGAAILTRRSRGSSEADAESIVPLNFSSHAPVTNSLVALLSANPTDDPDDKYLSPGDADVNTDDFVAASPTGITFERTGSRSIVITNGSDSEIGIYTINGDFDNSPLPSTFYRVPAGGTQSIALENVTIVRVQKPRQLADADNDPATPEALVPTIVGELDVNTPTPDSPSRIASIDPGVLDGSLDFRGIITDVGWSRADPTNQFYDPADADNADPRLSFPEGSVSGRAKELGVSYTTSGAAVVVHNDGSTAIAVLAASGSGGGTGVLDLQLTVIDPGGSHDFFPGSDGAVYYVQAPRVSDAGSPDLGKPVLLGKITATTAGTGAAYVSSNGDRVGPVVPPGDWVAVDPGDHYADPGDNDINRIFELGYSQTSSTDGITFRPAADGKSITVVNGSGREIGVLVLDGKGARVGSGLTVISSGSSSVVSMAGEGLITGVVQGQRDPDTGVPVLVGGISFYPGVGFSSGAVSVSATDIVHGTDWATDTSDAFWNVNESTSDADGHARDFTSADPVSAKVSYSQSTGALTVRNDGNGAIAVQQVLNNGGSGIPQGFFVVAPGRSVTINHGLTGGFVDDGYANGQTFYVQAHRGVDGTPVYLGTITVSTAGKASSVGENGYRAVPVTRTSPRSPLARLVATITQAFHGFFSSLRDLLYAWFHIRV